MAVDSRPPGSGNARDPLLGQTIANYRVQRLIGQGGMGAVYLARHTVLDRHAAIKVLLPEFSNNRELVGRFLNEARATAQLRHRGFVEIFDSGMLGNGSAYLAMEYLRGASLAAAIDWRKTFSPNETLAVLMNVAQSVAHAHKHGIVHRDLKPDNIFLSVLSDADDPAGRDRVTVKVLDFGIAKLTVASNVPGGSARTRTGSLLGTPLYMSPEQCRGAGQVDERTDIYSLGCIAYHALTGLPPFPLEGFGEIISAHLNLAPPPVRSRVPFVPEELDGFVLRMLEKNPAARPQTMDAVAAGLRALREGQTDPRPDELAALIPPATLTASLPSIASQPRIATMPLPDDDDLAHTPIPRPLVPSGSTRRVPSGAGLGTAGTFSTLSGSAVELGGLRPKRRAGWIVTGVGAAAALAVGLVFTLGRESPAPRARPPEIASHRGGAEAEDWGSGTRAEGANPPAAAAAPTFQHRPPAEAPEPSPGRDEPPRRTGGDAPTVRVRIASVPPAATIVDRRTKRVVGVTPFEAALPAGEGESVFLLKKRGYRPKELAVDLKRGVDVTLTLDRHPSAAAGAPDESEDDDRRKL